MASNEDSVPERASAPRTSQACRRCRSLKTRCLPSDQDGTCQRCYNAKRQCEWPEAQRRAKKLRGPSRISQVEQKIDVLVSRLADPDGSRPPLSLQDITPSAETSTPSLSTPESRDANRLSTPPVRERSRPNDDPENDPRFLHALAKIHDFTDNEPHPNPDPSNPQEAFCPPLMQQARDAPLKSSLVDELLTNGEADSILNEYRTMSVCFPFVPVASSTSAHDLLESKPVLLLAIITVGARKNRALQLSLEELYRRELAHRTIIEPRQTLSLLQSILVYLSWYHLFFSPKSRQLLPLVQIATGIALDLGMYQKEKRFINMPKHIKSSSPELANQREDERTWLGCYYISASLAGCVQKPNLINYTEYMTECCRRLKEDAEFPSDEIILPMLTIRHLRDQIGEIFGSDPFKDLPISDQRITIHFRYLETQLEECRVQQSDEVCERVLELSSALFQTELHSIGLRTPACTNESGIPYPNSAHLNSLISCLEGGKAFFDTLLTFPAADYHLIPSADWMRVPYVLITLTKLCVPSENLIKAQWDVKAAQDRVRLDLYLESLCYRMQSITTFNPPSQPKPDFWMAMKMIMDMTKSWYHRRIKESKDSSMKQSSSFRINMLQSLHQNMGQNNPFGQMSGAQGDSSFSPDMMGSMDMGGMGMPPVDGTHFGGSVMPPFVDMDFDMEQFLDMGLWASSEFPPRMFGGNHFGFG